MKKSKRKNARKLYNKDKFDEALLAEYENINDYIILHKRDTVRLKYFDQNYLKTVLGFDFKTLLQIDIDSLSSSLDFLIQCYEKTNKKFKILEFLDELRDAIDSDLWRQKIIYHKVCIKAFVIRDVSGAKEELKKIGDFLRIEDVELLTAYLDIMKDDLSFSDRISICEKIIRNTKCSTLKLQYYTTLGIEYLLINDDEKAIAEIEKGLNQFNPEKTQQEEMYTDYRLGVSYYLLGFLKQKTHFIAKARDYYLKSLSSNRYNTAGRANLLKLIGDCYQDEGEFNLAKDFYLQSIQLQASNIAIIYLMRILLQTGNNRKEISKWDLKIDKNILDENEKYDYLLLYAKIAIEDDNYESSEKTYKELEGLKLESPYFKELRDETVKNLMQFCIEKNSASKGKISLSIEKIYKSLILQPNLMGIGIDLKTLFKKEKSDEKE